MPASTKTQPEGELVIQIVAMPADTNANGDIFGGWVVSNMDLGASIAARKRSRSRVATVAIDQLVFYRPVNVGDTISGYASLIKTGRTSMQIKIEVWTMNYFYDDNQLGTEKSNHVAEGIFTFVAIDENGKPKPVDSAAPTSVTLQQNS